MIYQLPTGKIVHLTIDQFLDLTDDDIQYMISINHGDHVRSPFYDSAIKGQKNTVIINKNDHSMDYTPDDQDKSHGDNVQDNEILLDDIDDISNE